MVWATYLLPINRLARKRVSLMSCVLVPKLDPEKDPEFCASSSADGVDRIGAKTRLARSATRRPTPFHSAPKMLGTCPGQAGPLPPAIHELQADSSSCSRSSPGKLPEAESQRRSSNEMAESDPESMALWARDHVDSYAAEDVAYQAEPSPVHTQTNFQGYCESHTRSGHI